MGTHAAQNGVLFPAMISIRHKSKNYNPQWVCFNQAIDAQSSSYGRQQRPSILVVADEIFMMQDQYLLSKSRYSCPNTFMEYSRQGMNGANYHQTNDRTERSKYKDAWHNNMFCVQAHSFNNQFEPQDISIYDYLLSFAHEIISFKMMDRLVEYWNSNKIEWHLDRGLRLNSDGTQVLNPNMRGVSSSLVNSMNKY